MEREGEGGKKGLHDEVEVEEGGEKGENGKTARGKKEREKYVEGKRRHRGRHSLKPRRGARTALKATRVQMQMFCSASPAPTGPPRQSRPGTNGGNWHKAGSAVFKVVWYVSFFLLKNLALFVSAVGSAVAPGCKGKPSQRLLPMLEYARVPAIRWRAAGAKGPPVRRF